LKKAQAFLVLLILVVGILLIAFLALTQQHIRQKAQLPGGQTRISGGTQLPGGQTQISRVGTTRSVISRNAPAFASSGYYPASYANDDSYDTSWRSQGSPAWLAYDLSNVPAPQRSKVLLVWYNETDNFDHTIIGFNAYNMPQDYTIDVNPAPGGSNPPSKEWVTLISVKANHYHSREHVIDMSGNNWIRMNVTAVDGSVENYDANINMDIYNASYGTTDDWIFFGDSITAGAMGHSTVGGVKAFAQLINTQMPSNFPAQESGGIGYLTSVEGAKYINTWLELFPGKYVALSYGTNDANSCTSGVIFYNNYVTMVQAVFNAGKIPVIPHIPWARAANIQNCGPTLNAKIDELYKAFPQIIKGPDFWTFYKNNQKFISNDNIHPTDLGFGAYRQQWANAMLTEVYKR